MSGIAHHGSASAGDIHYSATFPVKATTCGTLGPSTNEWSYVTCKGCLARRPPAKTAAAT